MIATLRGRLRRRFEDRVIVECGGVGYEVFLPPVAMKGLADLDEIELFIHYHATRDQPRPVLIGFTSDLDREFFEKLITVKDIGPMVAARALVAPVAELAAAIARQDEQAKVSKFALAREGSVDRTGEGPGGAPPAAPADAAAPADLLRAMVWELLVKQLGHRPSEASQLITDAFRRKGDIETPEELFDEIYRGRRP